MQKKSVDVVNFGKATTVLPSKNKLAKGLQSIDNNSIIDPKKIKLLSHCGNNSANIYYLEELVQNMGCSINRLDIIDIDSKEKPFLNWDLNLPIPKRYYSAYDIAIDSGTHEHIFNIGVSLINFASLPKLNGYIIGSLPYFAPNHGFYNVNPNCIIQLFSPSNGYMLEKLIINTYESASHSLSENPLKTYTLYPMSANNTANANQLFTTIQRELLYDISKYNTMYYAAKRIKIFTPTPPYQINY